MAKSNKIETVVYHVAPDASTKGWVVSEENADFSREFDRKKDAEEFAKRLAQQVRVGQIKVRKKNGDMDYKLTYNQAPINFSG